MGALDKFFKPTKNGKANLGSTVALVISGVLAVGTVLAATIDLRGWIELGGGLDDTDVCASAPVTSFDQNFVSTANGDQSRITTITVESVPVACDGRYLKLNIYNSSNTVLESIVWHLQKVNPSDTSINAIADGSTITNASSNSVSRNFPASETDPLGLTLSSIDPAAISSFKLESSAQLLSED